jgi:hypothetical protein
VVPPPPPPVPPPVVLALFPVGDLDKRGIGGADGSEYKNDVVGGGVLYICLGAAVEVLLFIEDESRR